MLKTLIGDENFARGMQLYFDRHDGEATTIEHFYACFEQVSGQDLSGFRQWYSQPGTPQITLAQSWSEHSQTLSLTFTQDNPVTPQCQTPQPMTLPLKLAVFDTTGNKLVEETLIVSSKTTEWVFTGCPTRPLVSLNRGFSAPIKLTQKLSDADRLRLAEIDDDPFNQWQALQSLFTQEMLELAYSDKAVADPGLITACAQSVLRHKADPAYAALLLRLPDIAELMIVRRPADPEALFKARKHVQVALCEALYEDMQAYLATPTPQPFRPDAEQAGIRALRTAFIALLGASPDKGAVHQPTRFEAADNMTESLASLRALCATDGPGKNLALSAFYASWSDNPLVIDKWFSAQAAHGDASTIRDLLAHPDFDYSNPNRVRAVMAVFGMQNLSAFHARDGSGYALLAETIETVDSQNGALAARLLTAFEQWRSLDPEQSATARNILEDLKALSLSQNSRDILSRMLGE